MTTFKYLLMKHRILSLLLLLISAIAWAQPTISLGPDQFICQGKYALVNASVTGGVAPYTYQWTAGAYPPDAADVSMNPAITTTYTLTVTDANLQTATANITINVWSKPVVTMVPADPNCNGGMDGSISTTISGGTPPYSYLWSMGQTVQSPANLTAGIYTGWITDSNGCSDTGTVVLNDAAQVSLTFNNIVNATCGANDGSVCATVAGGTAPYTYAWNTGQATSCASNLQAGTYNITATDANGCTVTANVSVGSATPLLTIDSSGSLPILCNGDITGGIDQTVTGGTPPYSFTWSNAATTEDLTAVVAGTYTLTATDAVGCQAVRTFTISEPPTLVVDSVLTDDVTCYGSTDGTACVYISGGTAPYTYVWNTNPQQNTQCAIQLAAGTHSITVTDNNGCSVLANSIIISPPLLTVTILNTGDGTLPDTLLADITGGVAPYDYVWSTGQSGNVPVIIVSSNAPYGLTVADANSCTATDGIMIGCPDTCVWPGDADYSGVADNNDLLAIGLAYGTTGTARADQSIDWYAHQSTNWADYLGDTTNYKHIDCNGDGTINSDDTLAIIQNYNLTHPRSGPDEVRGGIPAMRVRMVPDTLIDGQTMVAHLDLGDANSTATDVYGLAFTFNFDALVVDTNEVSITFSNSSWLCDNATDHIDIDKKDLSAGKIHTALTRIDHTTRSGGGEIGRVTMKITTGNINGKELDYYAMNCYVNNLRVINNNGNVLDVDAIGDDATVQYEPLGINEVSWQGEVLLYPNPAQQQLTVSSSKLPIGSLQVINLLGEVVMEQQNADTKNTMLNIGTLSNGIYILKLSSGSSTYHTRFMVAK